MYVSVVTEVLFSGCSCKSWEATCVTDAGLKSLAALPNLVALSMSYLANVSDIALEAIARRGKLRKLVCRGCPTFTDVGCIRYINAVCYQYVRAWFLVIVIVQQT
jgi:hypothetical protein